MTAVDLSDDEFAKSHIRHMVGGKSRVPYERVFRFGEPDEAAHERKREHS
jgi:threonine dehydratase